MKSDNQKQIGDEDKKVIDEAVEKAKKVVANDKADKEELEAAAKELSDVLMPIGAKMYENAESKDAPSAEEAAEDKKDDGPVEGEVVDDKKD
jgi:hypothetical protein